MALRPELKARERVDRHRVGSDSGHVAGRDGATLAEDGAHAVAQAGKVPTGYRAADGEGDLVRPGCRHRMLDRNGAQNSAGGRKTFDLVR